MSKRSTRRFRLLLAVVVLFASSLACDPFRGLRTEDEIEELEENAEYTRDDMLEFFEEIEGEGEQAYVVDVLTQSDFDSRDAGGRALEDCDPGYPVGGTVPTSIDFAAGSQPSGDTVTITDANGPRQYSRVASESEDVSFVYCRDYLIDDSLASECVRFTGLGRYELYVRLENSICYEAVFGIPSSAATGDDTDATTDAQSSGGAASAENCVAPTDAFVWEFIDITSDDGTRATQCLFGLEVRNTGGEEICFRVFEAFDDQSFSTDGWAGITKIGPGAASIERYSYVEWDDGSVTFSIPVRLMAVRSTRECELWLGGIEDPFVDGSIVLPNPCE